MDIYAIISKFPLLSEAETLDLLKIAQSREEFSKTCDSAQSRQCQRAKERLINHNLRLVITIARKYKRKGLEMEDLIQEGVVGLEKAVRKFDPSFEVKFGTYATFWIRQSIIRFSYNSGLIRLPVHIREKVHKIQSEAKIYQQTHQRKPSVDELARLTGIKEKTILSSLAAITKFDRVLSTNNLLHEDAEYGRSIGCDDSTIKASEDEEFLNSCLCSLSRRDRHFLQLHFFEGLNRQESAELAGLPSYGNGKIYHKIIKKLQKTAWSLPAQTEAFREEYSFRKASKRTRQKKKAELSPLQSRPRP